MNFSAQPKSFEQSSHSKPDKAKIILAGALEVFITHGYSAASMDRIASAAGVSKSTLYSYFQDKERLFVAVIQQFTLNNHQIMFSLLTDPDLQDPPEKVLHQIATSVLKGFAENRPLPTLMRLVIGESERFPELAQTFVREIQKPLLEQLSGYLASQPQLKLSDPMVTARMFAGSLVHYLIVQEIMHGSEIVPMERERMVDGLVSLITTVDRSDRKDDGHSVKA
ncbi:MAG: TetR/AcrR family transcriptional regulator [Leptolyngbya sp. SIO1E4]|nr:TetR/AcrR family transcriptional regulator [Leptolyngbya sp. SIO1E4]